MHDARPHRRESPRRGDDSERLSGRSTPGESEVLSIGPRVDKTQYTGSVEGFPMLQIKNFIRDERGEDLIEYGLLAAFVAAIAVAVIIADPLGLMGAVEGAYADAVDALNAM